MKSYRGHLPGLYALVFICVTYLSPVPARGGADPAEEFTAGPATPWAPIRTVLHVPIRPNTTAYTLSVPEGFQLRDEKVAVLRTYVPQATSALPAGSRFKPQTFYLDRLVAQQYRLRPGTRTPQNGERVTFPWHDATWTAGPRHDGSVTVVFNGDPGDVRQERLLNQAARVLRPDIAAAEKRLHRVHLVFDAQGQRIFTPIASDRFCTRDPLPLAVDLDENDVLYVHVIAPVASCRKYRMTFLGQGLPQLNAILGNFAADKSSSETIDPQDINADIKAEVEANEGYKLTWEDHAWTELVFRGGPFGKQRVVDPSLTLYLPDSTAYAAGGSIESILNIKINLVVHTLYPFEFRLGVFAGNFPRVTGSNGTERTKFDLVFTLVPYVWRWLGRDPLVPPVGWERVNPLLGIGLTDFGNEYYAGVDIQLTRSIDVALGLSYQRGIAHQLAVPPNSSLEDWKTVAFVGVTFPAEIFGRLINAVR